jgi:hypothetical protein
MLLALLEHQVNHEVPVNITGYIYDIRKLLELLEDADKVGQIKAQFGNDSDVWVKESQRLLIDASEFVFDHSPTALSWNLCRLLIDFIQYELQMGYPTYVNDFLPDVIAMLEWLDEGVSLVKLKPRKKQEE